MVRHKNRYLIIKITEGDKDSASLDLKPPSLHLAIFETVERLHGEFGAAAIKAGFTSKYCNPKTRMAVVRARHGPHKLVASSLPFIKTIEGKNVKVDSLYTGATIKHCFKFLQAHQQAKFDSVCANLKTEEEKLALKTELLSAEAVLSSVQ